MSQHPFVTGRGMLEYPFPLSNGDIALLMLPRELTREEAERLIRFIEALSEAGGVQGQLPASPAPPVSESGAKAVNPSVTHGRTEDGISPVDSQQVERSEDSSRS